MDKQHRIKAFPSSTLKVHREKAEALTAFPNAKLSVHPRPAQGWKGTRQQRAFYRFLDIGLLQRNSSLCDHSTSHKGGGHCMAVAALHFSPAAVKEPGLRCHPGLENTEVKSADQHPVCVLYQARDTSGIPPPVYKTSLYRNQLPHSQAHKLSRWHRQQLMGEDRNRSR